MKQRLRYEKKFDKLVTKNVVMSSKGAIYMVYIDPTEMTYEIVNQTSLRKYRGGDKINNMNVLKRKIKQHLIQLGCIFDKESRKRTFGICEKGTTQEKHLERLKKKEAVSDNGPASNP